MTKLICDRCGKEITVDDIMASRMVLISNSTDVKKRYDLCGDCIEELFDFMDEENE